MWNFNLFKKYRVTVLNEKWDIIKENIKLDVIPRIHEIIFISDESKYYRVVNVIHNIRKGQEIYIIIEEYTDDYALFNEKDK